MEITPEQINTNFVLSGIDQAKTNVTDLHNKEAEVERLINIKILADAQEAQRKTDDTAHGLRGLAEMKTTPIIGANNEPAKRATETTHAYLTRLRETRTDPVVSVNNAGANRGISDTARQLDGVGGKRPNPIIGVTTNGVSAADSAINIAARNRTATINVNYNTPAGLPAGSLGAMGPQQRATGGPVTRGMPYIVGEKRPELFVPNQSGTIVPRVSSGGGGGTVINVHVAGSVLSERDLVDVLARAKRRGLVPA
jgi:hypothetical protein